MSWIEEEIIQEIFQDIVVGEFERSNLRPFGDFLEMESNRYDAGNGFDTFQR